MKAKTFDQQFDKNVDITGSLDLSKSKRVLQEQKRVNVDFPTWMIESLDREARKLGVTRQSIIKVWLAERLEALPLTLGSSGTAQKRAQRADGGVI
ncbi:MAG: CopG family transcriptional regulator [Halothiobacillus sp. 24-54-40]|nr:MAG: CopG family transcriptional regulator [Halothiobacillus sp. 24-54-40]